jgi:hypothetical protein
MTLDFFSYSDVEPYIFYVAPTPVPYRVGKNPVYKKTQPGWVFLGFIGLYWVLLGFIWLKKT